MDESKWRLVGVASLAGAVLVGAVVGFGGRPQALPAPVAGTPVAVNPAAPAEIVVHVAGAVARPGLVRVPVDSRVADAVAAAGGATTEAALSAINLAAPLSDGIQVVVPAAAIDGDTPAAAPVDDGRVRVNQADAVGMDALPGVGPVLAERIVAYRDENGPFGSVEDLLDVPGIGESKLEAMRESVVVP
ncbi:MAG: ComEA family DNA-binding protein [Acidimicrobiia bacterium]